MYSEEFLYKLTSILLVVNYLYFSTQLFYNKNTLLEIRYFDIFGGDQVGLKLRLNLSLSREINFFLDDV